MLPENRLMIPIEKKKEILEKLDIKGNKKLIQSSLLKENIFLTLKDLSNLKATLKPHHGDHLQTVVDYLINEQSKLIIILYPLLVYSYLLILFFYFFLVPCFRCRCRSIYGRREGF